VIDVLKKLVTGDVVEGHVPKRLVTAICSIHQPSQEVFDQFDHLILVSHGSIGLAVTLLCGSASRS
jgi:hypothetical protein